MQLHQIAWARAHSLLAEIITLDIHIHSPITYAAKCEIARLQAVVTIAEYVPMKLEGPIPVPTIATATLPPLYVRIIAMLDKNIPRKGEWIAMKLKADFSKKIEYNSSLRGILSDLVTFGYARHVRNEGYYLASMSDVQAPRV